MYSSIFEFGRVHCCKHGYQSKVYKQIANNVDPDETAHYEPSHLKLHCLHKYSFWSTGMIRLNYQNKNNNNIRTTRRGLLGQSCFM